jgi:hypothetical protein
MEKRTAGDGNVEDDERERDGWSGGALVPLLAAVLAEKPISI